MSLALTLIAVLASIPAVLCADNARAAALGVNALVWSSLSMAVA